MAQLQHRYQQDLGRVFPKAVDGHKTLEIKFVRQDETLCGAHWRVNDKVWFVVGSFIQNNVCCRVPIDELSMREICEEFQDFLAKKHKNVRPIHGLPMMTAEDMADVLEPPPVNPWAVALTAESMRGKMPGALRLTARRAECCLLREPTQPAPAPITMQEQQACDQRLSFLEEQVSTLAGNMVPAFANFNNVLSRVQKRLGSLEVTVGDLKQRVAVLERKEQTDAERKVALT